jgi:hypothetical protein
VAGRRSSSRRDLNISLDPEIPMDRIVLNSRVGSDGTLRISLPPGLAEADHEVRIIVESTASRTMDPATEWQTWVEAMAGSWQGDFERPQQMDLEQREPLP